MNVKNEINKSIMGPAIATASLLIIPLFAMLLTNEVKWGVFDFSIAGILIFCTGFFYKLLTREKDNLIYRIAIGLSLLAGLMLIWVNMAVGILGSENNPANILYFSVLAVGFLGAIIVRLKPVGMAYTLFASAIVQVLVPVIAFIIWKPETISTDEFLLTWHEKGLVGVIGVTAFFIVLFIGAGLLFLNSAQRQNAQTRSDSKSLENI